MATKLEAFYVQSQGKLLCSHDPEELLAVVDGRAPLRSSPTAGIAARASFNRWPGAAMAIHTPPCWPLATTPDSQALVAAVGIGSLQEESCPIAALGRNSCDLYPEAWANHQASYEIMTTTAVNYLTSQNPLTTLSLPGHHAIPCQLGSREQNLNYIPKEAD